MYRLRRAAVPLGQALKRFTVEDAGGKCTSTAWVTLVKAGGFSSHLKDDSTESSDRMANLLADKAAGPLASREREVTGLDASEDVAQLPL